MDQISLQQEKGTSLWKDAWIKLSKNYLALFGLGILALLCIVSILTPWIAPYGYEEQNLMLGATAPSLEHWLGTDIFGRDMLTRIMYGGRVSLTVGFIATAVALIIGVLWGAIAGFVGGRVDGLAADPCYGRLRTKGPYPRIWRRTQITQQNNNSYSLILRCHTATAQHPTQCSVR